jgi:hypothetical protein
MLVLARFLCKQVMKISAFLVRVFFVWPGRSCCPCTRPTTVS